MSGPTDVSASSLEKPPVPGGLAGALSALWRGVAAHRLYGSDHPSTRRALDEGEQAARQMDGAGLPALVAVGPERLEYLDQPIGVSGELEALRGLLRRGDVAGLRVRRGPTGDEFARTVEWLAGLDRGGGGGGSGEWIEVLAVSGQALKFVTETVGAAAGGEGVGAAGGVGGANGDRWKLIVGSLAAPSAAGPAAQVRTSIETLRGLMDRATGEQAAGARRILEAMADVEAKPAAQAPRDDRWIGATLASLPTDLRRSLLALASVGSPRWVATHADVIPLAEISAVLRGLADSGLRPPAATLLMLQKLVGLTGLNVQVRSELDRVAAAWSPGLGGAGGAGEAGKAAGIGGAGALTELLVGANTNDFCPEDYRENLSTVASRVIFQSIGHVWEDDFAPEATASRVAQVGLWLMADTPQAGVSNAAVLAALADRVGDLTADDRRALVLRLAAGASAEQPDDTREGYARVLSAVKSPTFIDALLADLTGERWAEDVLLAMVQIEPAGVVRSVIGRVAAARMSPGHPQVKLAAASAGEETLASACAAAIKENAAALAGVLAVLTAAPTKAAWGLARRLLEEPDAVLRREVVRTVDQRPGAWDEALVIAALTDAEPAVFERAAQRLVAGGAEASSAALAQVLTRGVEGADAVDDRVVMCVVTVLARRGPEGRGVLVQVLEKLRRTVKTAQIRICRRIADVLAEFQKEPDVSRALKQWRRSVGFTVGLFVVEDTSRRAA